MKILYLILARKNSKRLKNKNLSKINNQTLVQLTIKFAKKLTSSKNIVVSTDSKKINLIANKMGIKIPWLRPKNLSKDTSSSYGAAIHAINWYEKNYESIDTVILLQPTSPFRSIKTFKTALSKFKKNPKLPLVTIKKVSFSSNKFFIKKNNLIKVYKPSKREDFIFVPNGSVFIINKKVLKKNKNFFSNKMNYVLNKNFKENIDIDTQNDLNVAKKIYFLSR